jgi:hypothetical protein
MAEMESTRSLVIWWECFRINAVLGETIAAAAAAADAGDRAFSFDRGWKLWFELERGIGAWLLW